MAPSDLLGCSALPLHSHEANAMGLQVSLVAFSMYAAVRLFEADTLAQCGVARPRLGLLALTRGWVVPLGLWLGLSGAGGDPPAQHPVFAAAGDSAAGLRVGVASPFANTCCSRSAATPTSGPGCTGNAPAGVAFVGRPLPIC